MHLEFTDTEEDGLLRLSDLTRAHDDITVNEHELYRVVWVKEGVAQFVVDAIPYEVTSNQVAFFTPHNMIESLDRPEVLISFEFNREFYCIRDHDHEVSCHGYLFYGSSGIPVITLSEREAQRLDSLLSMFREEFGTIDNNQREMLRMLLKQLLIKGARLGRGLLVNPAIEGTKLDLVRQYNVLVEMYFRQKHKVKDYADLLAKSPKTLSNLFSQYNNRTPLQIINERIALEAKRLLVYSDKTVDEITYELGYKEAPHFSKFFKKQSGFSPNQFRKAAQLRQSGKNLQ